MHLKLSDAKKHTVFQYFNHGHNTEFVQGKKETSVLALKNSGLFQRQIACQLNCSQNTSAEHSRGLFY